MGLPSLTKLWCKPAFFYFWNKCFQPWSWSIPCLTNFRVVPAHEADGQMCRGVLWDQGWEPVLWRKVKSMLQKGNNQGTVLNA